MNRTRIEGFIHVLLTLLVLTAYGFIFRVAFVIPRNQLWFQLPRLFFDYVDPQKCPIFDIYPPWTSSEGFKPNPTLSNTTRLSLFLNPQLIQQKLVYAYPDCVLDRGHFQTMLNWISGTSKLDRADFRDMFNMLDKNSDGRLTWWELAIPVNDTTLGLREGQSQLLLALDTVRFPKWFE